MQGWYCHGRFAGGLYRSCAAGTRGPYRGRDRGDFIDGDQPVGYETIYLSGMTGTLRAPDGSPPGTPGPDSGDTEAQATRALGNIKTALASKGLGFGDIVMMHAYLAPDPQTGRGDSAGWSRAYSKFFGVADQPNKPARSSITVVLGSPAAKIEIETIAVRKPAEKK